MIRNKEYTSFESKLFTFLITFMMLGNVYQFPRISQLGLGEILLIAFFPFYMKVGLNTRITKSFAGFVLYFIYLFIESTIMLNYFDAPLGKLFAVFRVAFYWVVIFYLGRNLFDMIFFKKCLIVFTIALSSFILIQAAAYKFLHFYIPGYVLFFPLNRSGEDVASLIQNSLDLAGWRGFIRPSGFLLEPAHCVQSLFVGLILFMNDQNMLLKKKIFLVSLITIAMIATFSTTGVVLLLFSWICFMFVEKKMFYIKLIVAILVICGGIYMSLNDVEIDNWAVGRFVDVLFGSNIDGSSNARLNNGLALFENFPLLFKFFGTGMGLFDYVSVEFGFENALKYMNSLSGILFSAGFVGMIIWLFSLIMFFLNSGKLGKCMVVGFFIMTTGCSIFCQPVMVWIFLIILADIKEKEKLALFNESGSMLK